MTLTGCVSLGWDLCSSCSLSRLLSSLLTAWHFSGRSSGEILPLLVSAFPWPSSPPGQSTVARVGWDIAPTSSLKQVQSYSLYSNPQRIPVATNQSPQQPGERWRNERGRLSACFYFTSWSPTLLKITTNSDRKLSFIQCSLFYFFLLFENELIWYNSWKRTMAFLNILRS